MPANTVKRFCLRENADLILKWSKACSSSHSKCRQSSAPLPTRIIDVGCLPEDIPRLCSGENRSDPYCALSHCWGSSQPLRTTKATLHEGESGIAWHLLPQTFQDAMIVTRRLSIRYLWIDSLCIIQDDELDWQRESTRMAFIYGNAYLVISATHAAQGSTGCFSERLPQMLCYIHKTSNNDEIPIYVEPASEIHSSFESLSIHSKLSPQLPLLSRSWCFQERLLATRVLHFAGDDLIWECRSKTLCECTGLDPQKSMKSIQGSFVDERHSYALWHKLLKVYMSRQKTYPSDRLPAISGIAQQMQHAGLGDYVFGIWKENLFEDLLW
ncbi:heterokaryon incompatibility protein-domain-containing protein, partial [Tricladium varicosporioides]